VRVLLRRADRYRIYPTPEQIARLDAWDDALRWLWNLAHEQRLMATGRSKDERRYPTAFDQINELTELRAEAPWLAEVPRNVCAQLLVELDLAWQRCFKGLADRSRFKRKGRDRAPMIEPHPKLFKVEHEGRKGTVTFPKLGAIRAVIHRLLRGKPKTCAIVRDGDAWFACISCEVESTDPAPNDGPAVGIDRGVINLLADSEGRVLPNPRPLAQAEQGIAAAQRRVAVTERRSKRRARARLKLTRRARKVRRQRDHILHTEAKTYAKNHGTVVVEDLKVKNMTRSAKGTVEEPGTNVAQKAGLNRAILDSGWSRFVSFLRCKSEQFGSTVIEVPAHYSSQECAECHHVASESRTSQSEFECVACGHRDHADVNAAKVLCARGSHGKDGREVPPKTKRQLRVARRATRSKRVEALESNSKASAVRPG
jgi:putative transposase